MSVLESGSTSEPESRRQRRQDGLRDNVATGNSILQDLDIRAVLDGAGQVGARLLDFISSNLSGIGQSLGKCLVHLGSVRQP